MAYIIEQQPPEHVPAYNQQIYVVKSGNYAQPNFKYIAKIYLGAAGVNGIIVRKRAPHPTLESTWFDVGQDVERLVTQDIMPSTYGFFTCGNSIAEYHVKFYEEYEIAGVLTESALMATGGTKRIFNACLDSLDYQSYAQNDYLIDATLETLNHSLTREVRLTDRGWLHYLIDTPATVDRAKIDSYDSLGVLIKTVTITNPYQTDATLIHHNLRVDCAPAGLNLVNVGLILTGTQPIIPTNTSYYFVTLRSSAAATSISYRFNVVEDHCRYDVFRLHYLNNKGAIESFNFELVSEHTEEIKRTSYKGVVGGLTTSTSYSYTNYDHSERSFHTVIKDKYKIRSNWISEDYSDVLEELVSSPYVIWDHPTYGFISINITKSDYKFHKKSSKKMINLELDFELSRDRYRQRY